MASHRLARLLAAAALVIPTLALARPADQPDGSVRVGAEVFGSASDYYRSSTFRTSGARCGSEQHAPRAAAAAAVLPTDCSLTRTSINSEYNDNRVFVIQVVFHVIQKLDGTGAISPQRIADQIAVLNEDYSASDMRIKFVLARLDPDGAPTTGITVTTNDAWFADPDSEAVNPMKLALRWDPSRYLNIYTNDAAGWLGYATFPQDSAETPQDGIVLLHSVVGRNLPGQAPYDLGRTLTHEVGHYLGLYHPFQGGCGSAAAPYTTGDLLADTVPELEAVYGCTPAPSACGGGKPSPIENFMSYSDDRCLTRFTPEQVNRLRCSVVNYREINTEPRAAFTYTVDKAGVAFRDTSQDDETPDELEYRWSFGDGTTSTDADPIHKFAAGDSYSVTLEVIDPNSGTSRMTQTVDLRGGAPGSSDQVTGGCAAGGGGSLWPLLGLGLAMVRRRRAMA